MFYNKERKKVACIIPPYMRLIESKNNRASLAMHYIAEILYRRGHDVIYINGDFIDDKIENYSDRLSMMLNDWLLNERLKNGHVSFDEVICKIKDFMPDFVFISAGDVLVPTIDNIGNVNACSLIAGRIKEEINRNIVCVGYGHLFKYSKNKYKTNFDVIISSEAEEYAPLIVEKDLKGELNDSWTKNLDELPILTNSYFYQKLKPQDFDYIMSMRGCPNQCNFCFQSKLRGNLISQMSPERFIREIRYRIDKIGTSGYYFCDMIFIPGITQRTDEMLERLINIKKDYPNFNWWAESRVDTFNNEEVAFKMKKSGCNHLKFGVEAGNQNMLNYLKKGINLMDIKKAFMIAKNHEIKRTAYVLLGCPGFTNKDYLEMYYFFKELKADNYVVNINIPYKGTEIYEKIKNDLHKNNLYLDGEEEYIHTSHIMKDFWGISDETLKLYFSLQGIKDDSVYRIYERKIVDRNHYLRTKEIKYIKDDFFLNDNMYIQNINPITRACPNFSDFQ